MSISWIWEENGEVPNSIDGIRRIKIKRLSKEARVKKGIISIMNMGYDTPARKERGFRLSDLLHNKRRSRFDGVTTHFKKVKW